MAELNRVVEVLRSTLDLDEMRSHLGFESFNSLEAAMNSFCDVLGNPDRGVAPFLPGLLVSDFDYSRFVYKETPDGLLTESPKF